MSTEERTRLPHLPALDGVRGVAVVAVLFFHGGFEWAKGGYLGVSVFFTLSGFLITNLLVAEWRREGRISLRTFWSRRFRRLMPAAIATLAGIALFGWLWASPEQLADLRGDILAALGYVANWRFLLADVSYADLFSAPSPAQHFWSLAIEEQFYVAYPLIVFGLLRVGGRRALTLTLVAALAASLAAMFAFRENLDRVYYGTDTRMAELLAGGLLALWWSARVSRGERPARLSGRLLVAALGLAGLAGSLALWPTLDQTDPFLVRGGLPLQAALSVAIIAAAARPGIVARLLAVPPLVALGLVSYGLYLFHWPVFLVLTEERTGLDIVPLFVVRMAVTGALAIVSYQLLEQPIRLRRLLVRPRTVAPAALAGVGAVVVGAVLVTQSIPSTPLAHADVDIDDQTVTVVTPPPTPTTTPAVPPPVPAPSGVMIVGDSGTYDAAPAIAAQFQALGTGAVVDATFPGFGLTRNPDGWRNDWPALVAEHDVELSVVMLGGWDEGFVESEGVDDYLEILREVTAVLTAEGGHVLWLGMMPGPDTETEQMDAIFRSFAEEHPEVTFAEIDEALQGADGGYPRWIPGDDGGLVLARKPDGWHLCPAGAAAIAELVAEHAAEAGLAPPPASGWEDGLWREAERFDDPPGGCDPTLPSNAP